MKPLEKFIHVTYLYITLFFIILFAISRWDMVLSYGAMSSYLNLYIGWLIVTIIYVTFVIITYEEDKS